MKRESHRVDFEGSVRTLAQPLQTSHEKINSVVGVFFWNFYRLTDSLADSDDGVGRRFEFNGRANVRKANIGLQAEYLIYIHR